MDGLIGGFIHTLVRVGSTATVSTLPACPRQQCRAFSLFLSEFHSHSSTVWSSEAVSSSEVSPSETARTHKTNFNFKCVTHSNITLHSMCMLINHRRSVAPLFIQATSFTTSVCPATVTIAFPSRDQIRAVLSYDPVRILKHTHTREGIKHAHQTSFH